jgi:hypothetical protein
VNKNPGYPCARSAGAKSANFHYSFISSDNRNISFEATTDNYNFCLLICYNGPVEKWSEATFLGPDSPDGESKQK